MNTEIWAKRLLLNGKLTENTGIQWTENGPIPSSGSPGEGLSAAWVTEGLIDPHLHGGRGFDVMHPTLEGVAQWLDGLLRHGVSEVLPSVYTGPTEVMRQAMAVFHQAMALQAQGELGGARISGIHLEGPFISLNRLGAMDAHYVLPPSVSAYQNIVQGFESMIRLVTLAPEEPGADELIDHLLKNGVQVQAGHTDAQFEQAERAFERGVNGVCHFFNGIRGIHHREPGILTSALLHDEIYAELIADMVHVHPGAAQLICKNKGYEKIILISDAVSTTSLPDGIYWDNGNRVTVSNGESRVEGGSLNGGGVYLLEGARRMVRQAHVPIPQALFMANQSARRYLGLTPPPCLIGLNEDLSLKWVAGSNWVLENRLEEGLNDELHRR